jgi:hypothetical protein
MLIPCPTLSLQLDPLSAVSILAAALPIWRQVYSIRNLSTRRTVVTRTHLELSRDSDMNYCQSVPVCKRSMIALQSIMVKLKRKLWHVIVGVIGSEPSEGLGGNIGNQESIMVIWETVYRDSGLENREHGRTDPLFWPRNTLYPQKLTLTSPTSGGRSVGVVRSRTIILWSLFFFYLYIVILSCLKILTDEVYRKDTSLATKKTPWPESAR